MHIFVTIMQSSKWILEILQEELISLRMYHLEAQ